MNLLDLDYDLPQVNALFDETSELLNYIKGAKEMSGGVVEMKKSLPGILSHLRKNKGKLKWFGVETTPKHFAIIKTSIINARRLRMKFEIGIPSSKLPNKQQEIKDFIMAAFGLDVYLSVYNPDLMEGLELVPLESYQDCILKQSSTDFFEFSQPYDQKVFSQSNRAWVDRCTS